MIPAKKIIILNFERQKIEIKLIKPPGLSKTCIIINSIDESHSIEFADKDEVYEFVHALNYIADLGQ